MREKIKKALDAGSGSNPLFEVGFDVIHTDIDRHSFHLEVLCDGCHLPFVDSCFVLVHASHVLEHISNPFHFIQELKRVSSRQVVVRVPNGSFYVAGSMSPHHIFSWNEFTLANLLRRFFDSVRVSSCWKLKRTNRGWLRNKVRTFKFLFLSKFLGNDELLAICNTKAYEGQRKNGPSKY